MDFNEGTWGIFYLNNKNIIGKTDIRKPSAIGAITTGESIRITQAFEMIVTTIPVQGPQGIGMQRMVNCAPVDHSLGPATVNAKVIGIHFFDDMNDDNRKRHESLIKDAVEKSIAASAARAGISLARPGMPGMPGMPGLSK